MIKKILITCMIALSLNANASPTCEDSGMLSGKLMTDVCWSCIFPIRFAGVDISKSDDDNQPDDAAAGGVGVCPDTLGVPRPGFTVSMWEPAYVVETTRTPGCALAMNGTQLGFKQTNIGSAGEKGHSPEVTAIKHYHFYKSPLLMMMNMISDRHCVYDGAFEFDIVGISELSDPIWYSDELAFFANPEVAAVANPLAQLACAADAAQVAFTKPNKQLFWCAGSWGTMYPFSGNTTEANGPIINSSLQTAKVLATNHRRGFMWGTVGEEAQCGGEIKPVFPKQQYKYNMFHPMPETEKSHRLGQTPMTWGWSKYIPMKGEDQVYIVFRYTDCLYRF